MNTIIGIDPGKSGGISILEGTDVFWFPMPESEHDLWAFFDGLDPLPSQPMRAAIEWIHPAIQGVGKSSMSKLYGNYMALRMALTAAAIPFDVVKAVEWQRGMGITKRKPKETTPQWKGRLRARAQQVFPKLPLWTMPRSKGLQLQVSDALLIAEWLRRRELKGTSDD